MLTPPLMLSQQPLSPPVQDLIFKGMTAYGLERMGFAGDNLDVAPTAFQVWDGERFVGAIVVKVFWGQTHIRLLYVDPAYQGRGVGSALMAQAVRWAQDKGCTFMFVETMSFQAGDFYQKQGFVLEFQRPGYAGGSSQFHLRRDI